MRVDNHAAYFGVDRYGWPDIAARPDNHAAYLGVERYGWPDSEARADDRAAYYSVEMHGTAISLLPRATREAHDAPLDPRRNPS